MMAPPPSTPASRFQLPKRRLTQQHDNASSTFASTLRFAPLSSSRVPTNNPPAFSAPAPSRLRKPSALATQDFIDSSPECSNDSEATDYEETEQANVEVKSSFVSETPPRDTEPPAKRRRVSVSPDLGAASDIDDSADAEDGALPESIEVEASQDQNESREQETSSDCQSSPTDQAYASKGPLSSGKVARTRQPAFVRPPLFQTLEAGERPVLHPLPDVFSPRKQGAKYMQGGLAAELRDWLVGVKGSDDDAKLGVSEARLIAESVRVGSGMWIVHARRDDEAEGEEKLELLLAGTGRISGLARPHTVKAGGRIVVAPPTWEVTLEGLGIWTVACDWSAD